MTQIVSETGSFRDRRGRVYTVGGRIYRSVMPMAVDDFEQMLRGLRRWIAGMEPRTDGKSVWQDYAQHNSYADEEASQKRQFVADFVGTTRPGLIFDLGCNTGDYSALALKRGAQRAVGFDFDHGVARRHRVCAKSGPDGAAIAATTGRPVR